MTLSPLLERYHAPPVLEWIDIGPAARFALPVRPGALSWFGRLPGDIRIERPNARVYIPITSMVLISLVLSILFGILRRSR